MEPFKSKEILKLPDCKKIMVKKIPKNKLKKQIKISRKSLNLVKIKKLKKIEIF